jgi:hypothetical protein
MEHYIKKRILKGYKNSYYLLSKGILRSLNNEVPIEDKIKIV